MAKAGDGSPAGLGWVWLLLALGAADVASTFESLMMVAALPSAIRELGSASSAGWLVTIHLLVSAIAAAIGGRLADIFGRRRVLLVSILLCVIGSIISFVSNDLAIILAGRAIQGASGAIVPITLGLVREHCPKDKVSLCVGLLLSATGVAATAGLVIGGLIIDNFGWRHIFGGTAIFGAMAFLACLPVPKSARQEQTDPVDIVGAVLFVPMLVAFLTGIDQLSDRNLPSALGLMLIGAVLMIVWWWHERRHSHPLIDVRLLAGREMAVLNICALIWAAGAMQFTQIQMLFLQQPLWTGVGLGLAATLAGTVKIPAKVATMFVSPLAGHLVSKIGSRLVIVIGFVISAAGWVPMLALPQNVWVVMIVMTLGCAVGQSTIYAGLSTAVVIAAPGARTSEASGVVAVSRIVGQALGVQITLALLSGWSVMKPGTGQEYPAPIAYEIVFLYIIGLCALGMAVAALLPRNSGLGEAKPSHERAETDGELQLARG